MGAIFLDEKLEIFKCHFPEEPILPGALIFELCCFVLVEKGYVKQNDIKDYTWNAKYIRPVKPGSQLSFEIKVLHDRYVIDLYESNNHLSCVTAHLSGAGLDIKEIVPDFESKELFPVNDFPKRPKDILFLDKYFSTQISNNSAEGYGILSFKKECLDVAQEISDSKMFGVLFCLLEFMSLTVLSLGRDNAVLHLKEKFGFVRLNNIKFDVSGIEFDEELYCKVGLLSINNKTMKWYGRVFTKRKVIFDLNSAINYSFIGGKGE
ncbi:hypothetical protein L1D11_09185 [Vibrio sp. Isolate32]|uniref:hypothetical protein n=2 Tax=unclassified Vibrio TaxID=2614977 RepID=UPI001EFC5B6D|nr:hypothetical protein [Vibrio sp. Isolate32]